MQGVIPHLVVGLALTISSRAPPGAAAATAAAHGSLERRLDGRVIGEAKFASYRQADVFCFPTYFHCEALPVVLLEASACGLPIVATRWRGIPSIVEDGRTGFLVEPHDAEAVADRLAVLAQNVELRQEMGRAGRQKFEQEFTINRHLEQLRSVFLEVGDYKLEAVREIPNALATT